MFRGHAATLRELRATHATYQTRFAVRRAARPGSLRLPRLRRVAHPDIGIIDGSHCADNTTDQRPLWDQTLPLHFAAGTLLRVRANKDVDGRNKSGHNAEAGEKEDDSGLFGPPDAMPFPL
jgi:hypothetical protein